MFSGKIIFISALDWGLGHATRCVPVIRNLEKNNTVIIGVTPLTEKIFEEEFPHLRKINVPPYNITYSALLPLWMKLLSDSNRIARVIRHERKLLEEIIGKNKIDVVISDNRFGWRSDKAYSVFITHQMFLKTPFANSLAQSINKKYILNFNEIWIPDFEENSGNLSGELSHGKLYHKNVKYIGPLSRLQKKDGAKKKYDYLFLLSGPEPQRSIFGNLLKQKALENPDLKFALVNPENMPPGSPNLENYTAPDNKTLSEIICSSEKIICRSGYSTLMDLHRLGKKNLILVPTPGQTEQKYLTSHWKQHFNAVELHQNKIPIFKLNKN